MKRGPRNPRDARFVVEHEAADLLAGRTSPEPARLLELIHAINPTGRAFGRTERERRYATKARLQSLLIRRFPDEVRIAPDVATPGAVVLRARYRASDACHAVVAALDDDARAWVQYQLDVGGPDEPAHESHGRAASAHATEPARGRDADPLELARAAVAAFDFDLARANYERALDGFRGGVAAAELLALLVDQLGDDEAALALLPRLDAAARARLDVRARLAIATARQDDEPGARAWARGLGPERLAEVDEALVRAALARGDDVGARARLASAVARGMSAGVLAALEAEAGRLAARLREPHEAALRATFDAGDLAAAEAQARALLERWPDSEPARRVLRSVHHRAESTEHRALAAAARALEARNLRAAEIALRDARARGVTTAELDARLAEARAVEAARRENARVEAVVAALARGADEAALLAFLALEPRLRGRARERGGEPVERLEQIVAAHPHERATACAAAAIALGRAREALALGALDAAATELARHAPVLDGVAVASDLARQLDAARETRRAREVASALAAARTALDAGALDAARRRLGALSSHALDAETAAHVAALHERLARGEAVAQRRTLLERAEAAGDFAAASQHLHWLEARADAPDEAARWRARREALRERLRRSLAVRVVDGEVSPGYLAAQVVPQNMRDAWLTSAGDEMVIATGNGDWIFVYVVDVATCRARQTVALHMPPSNDRFWWAVFDDALWIVNEAGHAVALERGSWDVRCSRSLAELLGAGVTIAFARFAAAGDAPFLWLETRSARHGNGAVAVDLRAWRRTVTMRGARHWLESLGDDGAGAMFHVLCGSSDAHVASADGATSWPVKLPAHASLDVAAMPGDDAGLVFLIEVERPEGDASSGGELSLWRGRRDGTIEKSAVVAPNVATSSAAIARASAAGCFVVRYRDADQARTRLVVLDGALAELYRLEVPAETMLATDVRGRFVVATADGGEHLDALPIVATPPTRALCGSPVPIERVAPDLLPPFDCQSSRLEQISRRLAHVLDSLVRTNPRAREGWVASLSASSRTPNQIASLVLDLVARGDLVAAGDLARAGAALFPGDVLITTVQCELLAHAGQWSQIVAAFGAVSTPEPWPDHTYHVLGAAHYRTGDHDAARDAWTRGLALDSVKCSLEQCRWMVRDDGASRASLVGAAAHAADAVASLRVADACLARDDIDGAVAALDRASTFHAQDAQPLARLAYARLARPPRDEREQVACAITLAAFVATCGEEATAAAGDLIVPGHTWERDRVVEVLERARARLGALAAGADGRAPASG